MILVVDDNEDLRELFQWVLETGGFSVVTAATGGEALTCLRRTERIRLVLLDLTLPDMSGLELVGALKIEPGLAEIPILLVSGMLHVAVGRLPMLRKPVAPDDLLAAARYHALPA